MPPSTQPVQADGHPLRPRVCLRFPPSDSIAENLSFLTRYSMPLLFYRNFNAVHIKCEQIAGNPEGMKRLKESWDKFCFELAFYKLKIDPNTFRKSAVTLWWMTWLKGSDLVHPERNPQLASQPLATGQKTSIIQSSPLQPNQISLQTHLLCFADPPKSIYKEWERLRTPQQWGESISTTPWWPTAFGNKRLFQHCRWHLSQKTGFISYTLMVATLCSSLVSIHAHCWAESDTWPLEMFYLFYAELEKEATRHAHLYVILVI